MAATAVFMFKGIRAASAGESRTLTEMLQKRVAGQFGTLVVIMTSFAYFMSTTPEKKEEAEAQAHAMHQRGQFFLPFLVHCEFCSSAAVGLVLYILPCVYLLALEFNELISF